MSQPAFYVTTPIYYVNDAPHLGHAYTTVAADTLARWHRMKGSAVRLLTGTDEHGDKVLRAAEKRGISPQEHVDQLVRPFMALWGRLGIEYDDFIRTTEPRHVHVVQSILQRLYDQGDIYEDTYEGWYSVAAERFWTEKDLVDGKCPDTGQPVEWVAERNYFFRMSKYADQLREWIATNPEFLRPESRRNEVLGYLRKDVGDLCISRPRSRLPWGIEIPFASDYVTYVWFDALTNYVSAIGYLSKDPDTAAMFDTYWPADFHLVGKDILTTHSVYWSTMLFALGLEPARCLYAHGWWTIEGHKMSKSVGNVVDPNLLVDVYGPDPVRYFLLREIPFGLDGDFSHAGLMLRYNADLANDLGNLAHRALSMTEKWLGGVVPALDAPTEGDLALAALAARTVETFTAELEGLQFSRALEALWELVRAGNKYIDTEEPWRCNREGRTERLAGVMRRCLEVCRVAATLLAPVCPTKAHELAAKLGDCALSLEHVAHLDRLHTGVSVAAGDPLFPRMLELPERIVAVLAATGVSTADHPTPAAKAEKAEKAQKNKAAPPPQESPAVEPTADAPALIEYDDFAKIQLRAGKVLTAERHPKADRLLVLSVDVGEDRPRTIVAGIATRYAPEDLVGLTVTVVINLKPAKLRGIVSEGMLLAAGGGDVKAMVTLTEDVAPGTIVR